VDPRLHGQQEFPSGRRDREEGWVEPREGRLAGEDAEVVDDLVDAAPRRLGGSRDQPEQALVRVRLAEQVDRLLREDLTSQIAAVGLGQEVPKAREDNAVQAPILCRLIAALTPRGARHRGRRDVGFSAERQGPVAQRVFKTREVWQPQAG